MLSRNELLENVDEKYHEMLSQVNIPDFTKCIAQFSGLHISEIKNDVIKQYLTIWAKHKYRFWKLLNKKLYKDEPIKYINEKKDIENEIRELEYKYPTFAPWLNGFRYIKQNKLDRSDIDYNIRELIARLFPNYTLTGSLMTHFFKGCLNAPDELVTAIGRIFENEEVNATYTISIDPVDMMLASENPYNWTSCYRLDSGNDASHADGNLAAILDTSSLVTYIWNTEGKFFLYGEYLFKKIRYKRMRQWVSISQNFELIHFNDIYPGKHYSEDFEKILRTIVEDFVNNNVIWTKVHYNDNIICERENPYGYGEFDSDRVYKIKGSGDQDVFYVYDTKIPCPCGCGKTLIGSDYEEMFDEEIGYHGGGFICENFYYEHYCDLIDDYCEYNENCEECYVWRRDNAMCELDADRYCSEVWEAEDNGNFDPWESRIVHCGKHCKGCPLYAQHHPNEDPDAADNAYEENRIAEI